MKNCAKWRFHFLKWWVAERGSEVVLGVGRPAMFQLLLKTPPSFPNPQQLECFTLYDFDIDKEQSVS